MNALQKLTPVTSLQLKLIDFETSLDASELRRFKQLTHRQEYKVWG